MSKHSQEFKLEVVRHYLSGLGGYRATANKFGISHSLVRKWLDIHSTAQPDGAERSYTHRSAQSKRNVLERIQSEGLSLREACKRFNIAAASSILVWQKQYAQGGLAALERKPRERPSMKPFKPPTKPLSELTQAELARYVEYLQAENAYLKKLEALVQSKKQAALTKPK